MTARYYSETFFLSLLMLCFITLPICAQEVLISKDINVRLDANYELLGKVGDNILLFRDVEENQLIEVFDNDLAYKYGRDISLEGDKRRIYAVIADESQFSITYGVAERDSFLLRLKRMDGNGDLLDSLQLHSIARKDISGRFKYSFSEDRSKLLLFNKMRRDEFYFIMIDLVNGSLSWEQKIPIEEKNFDAEFQDILISNDEHVYMLFELSNNRYDRKKHSFEVFHFFENSGTTPPIVLSFPEFLSKDTHLALDEKNGNVLIIGLYTEANRSSAYGYFYSKFPSNFSLSEPEIVLNQFDAKFLEEVYADRRRINETLDYYFIKDVVFTEDGGFIWIGEMYREYFRRTNNPYGRDVRNYGDSRGYIDYYNEDMVVFGLDPSGEELWRNVLYKKQFSQDDEAINASFFTMKTPSRLRLLYNDEIKKSNTVSEYLLDPLGNFHRKTVLNTEYEKLRLQFVDSRQIDGASLVVPSLTASTLNLVKISFN